MTAWLVILGMALIVFLNRYVFIEPRVPLKLGRHVRDFLGFAVPGMLTGICAPLVFLPGHQLDLSLANPYLLAAACAAGVMYATRNVLASVLLSMAVFYALRWLM